MSEDQAQQQLDDELKELKKKMEEAHRKKGTAEGAWIRAAGNFSRALAAKDILVEPTVQRKKRAAAAAPAAPAEAAAEPPKKRGKGKKAKEEKK